MRFSPGETNVICTQLERSLVFYRDVLGYRVVEEEDGAVRLALGDRYLLLLPLAAQPAVETPYGERAAVSFDIGTADLAKAVGYLLERNVTLAKPWQPGDSYAVIRDPDGLCIEIVG